jgi:hypothetical protein
MTKKTHKLSLPELAARPAVIEHYENSIAYIIGAHRDFVDFTQEVIETSQGKLIEITGSIKDVPSDVAIPLPTPPVYTN